MVDLDLILTDWSTNEQLTFAENVIACSVGLNTVKGNESCIVPVGPQNARRAIPRRKKIQII